MEQIVDAKFFKALGDPTRIRLLARLLEMGRAGTVGEVACCTDVDMSVVSRHLSTLREAGIVASERKGKEVHYSVRFPELVKKLRHLADSIESCCPDGINCCFTPANEKSEEETNE